MGEDLITRIKMWICRRFGHKPCSTWEHLGKTHHVCRRCGVVYTDPA